MMLMKIDAVKDRKVQIFPSPAFVRTLPHALGLLSVLPTAVEREPAQRETSYHPPTWGQPKTYAAAPAIYVQGGDLNPAGRPCPSHRNCTLSSSQRAVNGNTNNANWLIINNTKEEKLFYNGWGGDWGDISKFEKSEN